MSNVLPFILVLFIACASPENESKKNIISQDSVASALTVKVAPARTGELTLHIHADGVCRANRRVEVALRQSGYIARLFLTEGAYVKKGQLLAMLDNGAQKIALSRARTALIKALATFGVDYPNPDSALAILEKAMLADAASPFSAGQLRELLSGKRQRQVRLAQSGVADARNDKYIEILSSEFNLKPGEPVVVDGAFSLAHNAKVRY